MKKIILIFLMLLIPVLAYADLWIDEQQNITPEKKYNPRDDPKYQYYYSLTPEKQKALRKLYKDLHKELYPEEPEEKTELEKRADAVEDVILAPLGKKGNSFLDKLADNPYLLLLFIPIFFIAWLIGRGGRRRIMLIRQGYLQPKEQRQLERKRKKDKPKITED